MSPTLELRRRAPRDIEAGPWLCFYIYNRTRLDNCGREVIATVPDRETDRHGTAVTVSDSRLAARLIIRITQIAVF